jgi:glycosyltransferase involved in cell wall biosynthesis
MNIFFIPSWYPSTDAPLSGIFSKEQAVAIAEHYPDCKLGISLWGQKSEDHLLWFKDHIKNLSKAICFISKKAEDIQLKENYQEYYTPALTWTAKILEGNIKNIIRANEQNLFRFEAQFGKTSLIHAHIAFPGGYIAMHLAKKYKLPYIITEQMSPFPFIYYLNKRGGILNKVTHPLQQANAVIAISPHAAKDIGQKTGVRPLCIPNLVDESLFRPLDKPAPLLPFTFFSLGRMVPQKGFPDLLQAITLMKHTDVLFRIGGEGELQTTYQMLAKKLNISDRIQWLDEFSRQRAAHEFQNCHAFVLPSIHESMGVVYAEAIACGKPIIASRSGGAEFIVNKNNGILVDINAPQQLAAAMDDMVENHSRYDPQIIRADFLKRFSSSVISKKIHTLYQSLSSNMSPSTEILENEY